MDVSDLRKRIIRALDDARKDASIRRVTVDEAARAYESFLTNIAAPVMRQAVLVSERRKDIRSPSRRRRKAFESLRTARRRPSSSLASTDPAARPAVIGRVSLARGRQALVIEERPIADKPVADVTEEDLSAFLVAEIPRLVVRS